MKISIITSTFNSALTLCDTLDSCRQQNYPHMEHILIDAVSTDSTLKLISQYEHVARIVSEPDQGVYDALNKGIALATGDVIGLLHSDDTFAHNGVLSRVAQLFGENQVDAVYGDLVFVDREDTSQVRRVWRAGSYRRDRFLRGWMPPHPTFFARKNLFDQYGGYNLSLRSSADYELMLRMLYKHKAHVAYLPEILVRMRLGGMSTKSLGNRLRAHLEDRLAWTINDLKPPLYTTWLKPLRKLPQFVRRKI